MSEWREVTLGELIDSGECAIYNNLRQPLSVMERNQMKQGKLYPYYGAASAIDFINKYRFDGCYLLIAEDGTVTFDGIRPMLQLVDGKFWVSNHAHVLQCESKWKTTLLYYLLLNIDINPYITGAVQPKLSKRNLLSILLSIPKSESEQRAIASVLSSLDDKIDLLHRENKTLEAMAETLFRQWFIEEADEDWKEGTISDIIDILSGFPFRSDTFVESGKYRLITIKSVQDGYLELSNTDMISDIPPEMPKYCYLKQGDILLTLTGNVGRCCLVDSDDLLLNQRVAKLKPKNNRDIAYTYVFFRMEKTKRLLEEMAKGTAQPNLSPVETAQMEILIPSSDKLEFFSDVANPLIQKLLNNRIQIRTLEKLRDTLLPKLMSGEVRVKYEEEEMASCRA